MSIPMTTRGTEYSFQAFRMHLEGAINNARFYNFWATVAGAQKCMAGSMEQCCDDPWGLIALRGKARTTRPRCTRVCACGDWIGFPNEGSGIWRRIKEHTWETSRASLRLASSQEAPSDGARENDRTSRGRTHGHRRTWPQGIVGGIDAMFMVDVKIYFEEGIRVCANPSGTVTVLTTEVFPPHRSVGITSIDGVQLRATVAEHGWFKAKGPTPETPQA